MYVSTAEYCLILSAFSDVFMAAAHVFQSDKQTNQKMLTEHKTPVK